MITLGSLFSGIGGLDLGLERAGMILKWQVEIDPYCNLILAKHWPNIKRYNDVRKIKWGDVERVDCICGGFPCPPVSQAGRRKGREDERWLWPEFIQAIRELRPRWVVIENVPGLLSANAGREFTDVLRNLSETGYDAEWTVIGARDIGAPHRRDRVFIVAYPSSSGRPPSEMSRPNIFGDRLQSPQRLNRLEKDMANAQGGGSETGFESVGETPGNGRYDVERCGNDVGHAESSEHSRAIYSRRGGCGSTNPGAMGNADQQGPQRQRGNGNDGCEPRRLDPQEERPAWPPSPDDKEGWARILARWPEYAPALPFKPRIRGMAHGVSCRLDQLRTLGNAVVPQVAQIVGGAIIEAWSGVKDNEMP